MSFLRWFCKGRTVVLKSKPVKERFYNGCLFVLLCVFLTLWSPAASAEIYRCKINGKTVFTDEPCEGAAVKLKPMNGFSLTDGVPTESFSEKQYDDARWFYNVKGYQKALKLSDLYKTPIFIYYQADWCKYCRKLENELLDKKQTQKTLQRIIKVQISPDDGLEEMALSKKMGVRGYPTIMIQKESGSRPKKYRLVSKQGDAWQTMTAQEFTRFMDMFL